MRQVEPYPTVEDAQEAFDNGGRFYNLFTHAGDQEITRAELGVAAGISSGVQLALFYELAVHALGSADRSTLESQFTPKLLTLVRDNRPETVTPEVFNRNAKEGAPYLITGRGKIVDDQSLVTGMMMMPIMAGKVTTFMPVPITEHFLVMTVRAGGETECTVLVPKGDDIPVDRRIHWAGVAKEDTDQDGKATDGPLNLHSALYAIAE